MDHPTSAPSPGGDGQKQEEVVEKIEIDAVQTLSGHTDRAWAAAWHPTQAILASCSTDRQLRLHRYLPTSTELANGSSSECRFDFQYMDSIPTGHTRTVRSVDWSPNGRFIASGSFDSTVSIWSNSDRRHLAAHNGALSDSDYDRNSPLDEHDGDQWECAMSLEGHESEVKGVAWNRSGRLVATCSRDKSVWIWEILIESDNPSSGHHPEPTEEDSFEVISVLMDHEQDVKSVCWSPVEDLLCSTSYDNNIHLYAEDTTSDGDFTLIHKLTGHESTVWDASFSPCGEFLASCSDDLSIRIWYRQKLARGGVEGRDGGLTGGWRIGRSESERWLSVKVITGFHSRSIYSLDWTDFTLITSRSDQSIGLIATCGGDGRIRVFEIVREPPVSGLDSSTPELRVNIHALRKRAHESSELNSIAWCKVKLLPEPSPSTTLDWRRASHSLLASAGDDGSVRIWKVVIAAS